jgi:hypothetical protein
VFVKLEEFKCYRREPKSYSNQVFQFKLDSFSFMKEMRGSNAWPHFKLKTLPSFCTSSLSLFFSEHDQ